MSLPSNTYRHYLKRISKRPEGLRWESRLRFIRSLYGLYPSNSTTSATEIKNALLHIAFSLSYLGLCVKTHLRDSHKMQANAYISQILSSLDQVAIKLILLPKRNKVLAQDFFKCEFNKLFTAMETTMCDIECTFAEAHTPLHRYCVK